MIPVPLVLIADAVEIAVHLRGVLRQTRDVIPRLTVLTVAAHVVAPIQNEKMTTLKYTRRRIACRKSGIIARKMNQSPIVTRMEIDVIGGGLDLEVVDIGLRHEDARHVIVHQDSKEIGEFLGVVRLHDRFS